MGDNFTIIGNGNLKMISLRTYLEYSPHQTFIFDEEQGFLLGGHNNYLPSRRATIHEKLKSTIVSSS